MTTQTCFPLVFLPFVFVLRIQEAGFSITHVYSSPFRRCLQTAAAAAREIGVANIRVHNGLSETTHAARKCVVAKGLDPSFVVTGNDPMYLSPEGKAAAVGPGIEITHADASHYCDDTFPGGAPLRAQLISKQIMTESAAAGSGDVLIVTHGDIVSVVGQMTARPCFAYEVLYCACVAVDETLGGVVWTHDVKMLDA